MLKKLKRRGRPITGSPKKGEDGLWRVRIPIPGTNRTRPLTCAAHINTMERASEVARHYHEQLVEDPSALGERKPADMMSNAEYLDAWTNERKGRIGSAEKARGDLLRHVFSDSTLRNKRCALTAQADLRAIVARLNARVELGELAWKTAQKVWKRCRVMYRESFCHELDSLRIRPDDPTSGIKGPRSGTEKSSPILYPDEVTTLLACPDVPLDARILWALLIYTGLRVSELTALDWSSVDLKRRRIEVHVSIDQNADEDADDDTKETKTGKARNVALFDPVYPLFASLHAESGGVGRVCQFTYSRPAGHLQAHIRKAGLERAALLTSDKTRRQLRAQDLRATCATWLGLCEQLDDGGKATLGQRAHASYAKEHLGHDDYTTTEKHYLRGKGLRVEHVGSPFPPLPASLLNPGEPGIPAKLTCKMNGGAMQTSETVGEFAIGASPRRTTERALSGANGHETSQIDDPAGDRVEPVRPRTQVQTTDYREGVEQEIGAFEMALGEAIQRASHDRRWDVVAQLARELEARRVARQAPSVVDLETRRRRTER